MHEIILTSGRLRVKIAPPHTAYSGTRFDHSALITSVTLDGCHSFCTSEPPAPVGGSGGIGLCHEFDIERAIGYEAAAPGQFFPKIGVGLLRKEHDAPYDFRHPYPCEPSPVDAAWSEAQARFVSGGAALSGFGWVLARTVSVRGSQLRIHSTLRNTGTRPIDTEEYCHNFLCIDGRAIGSGYALTIPAGMPLERKAGHMRLDGNVVRWEDGKITEPFYASAPRGRHGWQLVNCESAAGVRELVVPPSRETPMRFALWGYEAVVSPEVFLRLMVSPGEEVEWERQFEFFITNDGKGCQHEPELELH